MNRALAALFVAVTAVNVQVCPLSLAGPALSAVTKALFVYPADSSDTATRLVARVKLGAWLT